VASAVTSSGGGSLVAAFGFNEGSGSTTADASGKGNAGSFTGAVWSAGRYGQALGFDSSGDWVTVADAASLDLTTGMTLEAWVNPSALGGWRTILMKQGATDLVYAMYVNNARRAYAELSIGGTRLSVAGSSALPLNAWTHVAASYDGAALRLYVNGVQVSSASRSGSIVTSTGPLRIGGNSIFANEFWTGLIDEVRVYDRALSASEVQSDLNSPIGG
jgi:hypothetical protein